MKTNITKRISHYILTSVLALMLNHAHNNVSYAEGSKGVLIAAASSPVQKTSVLEIRRMYLGLPSSSDSLIKNTVINSSDSVVYKAFLKNVMHMTDSGYQRKIVKRIFRQGGKKVVDIQDATTLVNYLSKNPNDVSFMNEDVANKTKGIKVVQILW